MFEQQEQTEQPEAFDADLAMGEPSAESILLLLRTDPHTLGPDDGVAAAAGAELAKRLLDALQLQFLASAAGERREPGEISEVGQELSAATNLHPVTASCRADTACATVSRLPRTLAQLKAGRYTLRHIEIVERATRELSDEQAREVDVLVPSRPAQLKRRVLEAIARIAPEVLAEQTARVRKQRTVQFWTDALDGTAGISVQGPLAQVAQIKAAIDCLAGPNRPGECRNLDQRRFDAVYDWARSVLDLPTSGGEPRTIGGCGACGRSGPATIPINVTISLEALLRLSEAPGDLNGEPIPAEVARELAGDGRWRRWVFETGTGRLLDVGATTYRPGAALARFIRARDRTCTFPSCTVPAERCDLDHLDAFHTEGGETVQANLGAKCRTHHRLKGELDWTTIRPPTGNTDWTTPAGRTFTKPAEHLGDDPVLSAYLTRSTARRRERERAEQQRVRHRPARGTPGTPDPWMTPPNPDEEPPF